MQINELLEVAVNKRCGLSKSTNALRLVNGEGDGVDGITVDRYNRHFVIQAFKPQDEKVIESVRNFISANFSVDYLILKDRASPSGRSLDNPKVNVLIDRVGSKTQVMENNLKFWVDLNDTVNTGLFLDMRANRLLVAQQVLGGAVLNCFAYTCSFGVYCRAHGASSVINVDISRKHLDKGRENYQLNNISCAESEFIRAEAGKYLNRCLKQEKFFDWIILDPPSFSRHEGKVFTVKKEMPGLINAAISLLKPAGKLFVSTNFSGFSSEMLKNIVLKSRSPRKMLSLGQDIDFSDTETRESSLSAVLAVF